MDQHLIPIAPGFSMMRLRFCCLLISGLILSGSCLAQLNVDQSLLSFDIDNVLQLEGGLELSDDQLLTWSASDGYGVKSLFLDGRQVDLTGYTVSNFAVFMTFDTSIKVLDGSPQENVVFATPSNIINGGLGGYGRYVQDELEGSNAGIDGLSIHPDGFLLTLDRTTQLRDGSATIAEPADVFISNKGLGYPLLFDASEMGLEPTIGQSGLNVNAISWDNTQNLLYLSFDTGGKAAGHYFQANSILVFDPALKTLKPWGNALDGLATAGVSNGAKLNAMMLIFTPKTELIFEDGFE